jgi:hypothetical protein
MIRFLSSLGRGIIIISALLTILGCLIAGYLALGTILGIILGGIAGCLIAGTIFGLIATIYEINDNMRSLAYLVDEYLEQERSRH